VEKSKPTESIFFSADTCLQYTRSSLGIPVRAKKAKFLKVLPVGVDKIRAWPVFWNFGAKTSNERKNRARQGKAHSRSTQVVMRSRAKS
jgi:hypothetical protein